MTHVNWAPRSVKPCVTVLGDAAPKEALVFVAGAMEPAGAWQPTHGVAGMENNAAASMRCGSERGGVGGMHSLHDSLSQVSAMPTYCQQRAPSDDLWAKNFELLQRFIYDTFYFVKGALIVLIVTVLNVKQ